MLVRDAVCHRLEVAIEAVGRTDLDHQIVQNTIDHRLDELIDLIDRLRVAATA